MNQLRDRGGAGERIVFGLMLVVLICNFSSVWAQGKNKPIRKQRQTAFQPIMPFDLFFSCLFLSFCLSLLKRKEWSDTLFLMYCRHVTKRFLSLSCFSLSFPLCSLHFSLCLFCYLFSLPLRWALSRLFIEPTGKHQGGAKAQWDRPPRGQRQSEWVNTRFHHFWWRYIYQH